MKQYRRVPIAVALAMFATVPAAAQKLSDEILEALKGSAKSGVNGRPELTAAQEQEFLVQLQEVPETQEPDVSRAGAKLLKLHRETKTAVVRMTAREAELLAGDPNVMYISPDREVRASAVLD